MDALRPLINEAYERGCGDLVNRVIAVFIARDALTGRIDGMDDATKAKIRDAVAREEASRSTDGAAGWASATKG
jgi:hypothetical protein